MFILLFIIVKDTALSFLSPGLLGDFQPTGQPTTSNWKPKIIQCVFVCLCGASVCVCVSQTYHKSHLYTLIQCQHARPQEENRDLVTTTLKARAKPTQKDVDPETKRRFRNTCYLVAVSGGHSSTFWTNPNIDPVPRYPHL